MTAAELRRFVGGPFPNLVPGRTSSDGRTQGPYANLATGARAVEAAPASDAGVRAEADAAALRIPA